VDCHSRFGYEYFSYVQFQRAAAILQTKGKYGSARMKKAISERKAIIKHKAILGAD
jgi:hypothetical protein